jgi:hypothetical protein
MTASRSAARLAGYGLSVEQPDRWEGRIYQRAVAAGPPTAAGPGRSVAAAAGPTGWSAERPHPVLHLANFALPSSRGDYGTGAVEQMGPEHAFIALVQFGTDCLGTALYAPAGFPTLNPRDFNPNGLQRRIAGQAGFQHFFTAQGKPLCLYIVLGAHRRAAELCGQLNQVIGRIEVAR